MTSDQSTVLQIRPGARISWSQTAVEIRDGPEVIGSTRWSFREPLADIEARAWANAAKNLPQ